MQTRIETEISDQRQRLDSWLSEAYSREPDAPKNGELEAGYLYWGQIETLVGRVIDEQVVRHLCAIAAVLRIS
ncbi:hypothetical protein [Rubinisphaera italica]|uniref:Uncharacterized protein n=1 Tax=Rubinisphaera italica TaxID=2527969 RepID=A0A5C5XLY6_9PLAN|nr:hypothetical protein [Rubinisphaera italica]TWT62742.1 hypothetical protein Pan54_34870 [Rubinisphaera italica]